MYQVMNVDSICLWKPYMGKFNEARDPSRNRLMMDIHMQHMVLSLEGPRPHNRLDNHKISLFSGWATSVD